MNLLDSAISCDNDEPGDLIPTYYDLKFDHDETYSQTLYIHIRWTRWLVKEVITKINLNEVPSQLMKVYER